MKKTAKSKTTNKPVSKTPKDSNLSKEKREQLRQERAIRFSKLKKRTARAGEEEAEPKAGTNRERKHAYYAKKLEKEGKKLPVFPRLKPPASERDIPEIPTEKKHSKQQKEERRQLVQQLPKAPKGPDAGMRLNKYIAHAGVAARRKADELIREGWVKVNGEVVTEMGHKLQPNDVVTCKGKVVKPARFVYVLLNKPKDYISTVSDDRNRRTVMEIIGNATTERIYPVGRLDRATTGLLLFTNDGDLALQLAHPSKGVQKVYEVELNKSVDRAHLEAIAQGITLEDGVALVDDIAYPDPDNRKIVGITLHIGKNRVVRRIFEHLGYEVKRLDRTMYAGLTKKDLPRGRWRYLTPKEVITLKYLGKK